MSSTPSSESASSGELLAIMARSMRDRNKPNERFTSFENPMGSQVLTREKVSTSNDVCYVVRDSRGTLLVLEQPQQSCERMLGAGSAMNGAMHEVDIDDDDDDRFPSKELFGKQRWFEAIDPKDQTRTKQVILVFADYSRDGAPHATCNALTVWYTRSSFFHVHIYFPEDSRMFSIDQTSGHVKEMYDPAMKGSFWRYYELRVNEIDYQLMMEYCILKLWTPYDTCGIIFMPLKSVFANVPPVMWALDKISDFFTMRRIRHQQGLSEEESWDTEEMAIVSNDVSQNILQRQRDVTQNIFEKRGYDLRVLHGNSGEICSRFTIEVLCVGGGIDCTNRLLQVGTPGDVHDYITNELGAQEVYITVRR